MAGGAKDTEQNDNDGVDEHMDEYNLQSSMSGIDWQSLVKVPIRSQEAYDWFDDEIDDEQALHSGIFIWVHIE